MIRNSWLHHHIIYCPPQLPGPPRPLLQFHQVIQGIKPHKGWGVSARNLKYRRGLWRLRPPLRTNLPFQRPLIVVFHPTTTKHQITKLRPPCTYPDSSFRWFFSIFSYSCFTPIWLLATSRDLLNSSPSRTRLLLYPRDTNFYPGRLTTTKCSRTKKIEKRRTNEKCWLEQVFFSFYFLLILNLIKIL